MPISPDQEDGEIVAPPAAAARHAAGLHGFVAAFDPSQDDWGEYVECLEHYFTANDIDSEDKRRAILLNAVGASTYLTDQDSGVARQGDRCFVCKHCG